MSNEWDKYVKPKTDNKEKPRPAEPVVTENAAQNLAPAYDALGNYIGTQTPQTIRKEDNYAEDMSKVAGAVGRGADAFARGFADVVTLGNSDRFAAAGDALFGLTGEKGEYSKNLEAQRARNKDDLENRAPMRVMGQIAGGIRAPWRGTNFLQQGQTLPGRMIGGAEKGVTTAAPYAYFSSGEDLSTLAGQEKAILAAGKGALIGGGVGAAIPAIGTAIGTAVDFLRNRISPDLFSTLPRSTQRQVEQIARDTNIPQMQRESARLGPNAMMADVSPDMRLIAQNVATRPGAASVVVDPLRARDAARNERLQDALNSTLGPNVDRLQVTDRLQALREQAGARYPQLAATSTNQMPAFGVLEKIDAIKQAPLGRDSAVSSALKSIETVLTDPATKAIGRSAAEFHAARRIADRYLNNPNTPQDVADAVRTVRNELDAALKGNVDGWTKLDIRFSDIAGRQEAFQKGQTIFGSGREALRPSEDARYWNALNTKQQVADRLGVRAELDRLAGQSGNDLQKFNQTLMGRGDDPYAKLNLRFGPERTNRLYDTRDAERVFQETHNAVNSGSQTAQRMGANQLVGSGSSTGGAGAPSTFAEMALAAKRRAGDAFRDARSGLTPDDTARQLGRMVVAQGNDRDAYLRAMLGRANRTDPEADIERTLKALRPGIIPSLLR